MVVYYAGHKKALFQILNFMKNTNFYDFFLI